MGSLLIESRQRVADLELRQAEGAARWDRRSETLRDLGMPTRIFSRAPLMLIDLRGESRGSRGQVGEEGR